MTLEMILSDSKLNLEVSAASKMYETVLKIQSKEIANYFGGASESSKKMLSDVYNISAMFAGVYSAVKDELKINKMLGTAPSPDITNALSVALTSDALISYASNKDFKFNGSVPRKFISESVAKITYNVSDYNTITESIEGLTASLLRGTNNAQAKSNALSYFNELKEKSLNYVKRSGISKIPDIKLKSSYFEVKNINTKSDSVKPKKENGVAVANYISERFMIPPPEIKVSKIIQKDHIQGNTLAVNAIDEAVRHLMFYRPNRNRNPLLDDGGFKQYFMFIGDKGCGKTMVSEYAIGLATQIAKANNLPFRAVRLQFETEMQGGPVSILRYQLQDIVSTNMAQIVFLDEMESKFQTRSGMREDNADQKTITELLDFTNGVNYENAGKTIFIGATNLPKRIDAAIRDRFADDIYYCKGPQTAQEKINVLRINMKSAIEKGYVQISNWNKIAYVATELSLSGRKLKQAADRTILSSRTNHYPENIYKADYDMMLSEIKRRHTTVTDDALIKSLEYVASIKDNVELANAEFQANS